MSSHKIWNENNNNQQQLTTRDSRNDSTKYDMSGFRINTKSNHLIWSNLRRSVAPFLNQELIQGSKLSLSNRNADDKMKSYRSLKMLSPIKGDNYDLKIAEENAGQIFADKSMLSNEIKFHDAKDKAVSEHIHNEKINYLK